MKDINKVTKLLIPKKPTGPDGIPTRIIKLAANIINSHLGSRSVKPLFKKGDKDLINNYRPVSILNGFSKISQRYLHDCITPFVNRFLSKFISAYRKTYSFTYMLVRQLEEWKKH